MPDPYIVEMAELVLQALQPRGKRRDDVRRIERGRCFRRIAQLFQCDAQAMALLGRLLGELLAAFLRGPPAAPQDLPRNLADRRLRHAGIESPPAASLEPGEEMGDQTGVTVRSDRLDHQAVGGAALPLGGSPQGLEGERIIGSSLHRAQQGRLEHIEVPRPRERVGKPAQFLGGPVPLILRQPLGKTRHHRAQTPGGDPHLVDAARHAGERGGFVAREVIETGEADPAQRRITAERRVKRRRFGMDDGDTAALRPARWRRGGDHRFREARRHLRWAPAR